MTSLTSRNALGTACGSAPLGVFHSLRSALALAPFFLAASAFGAAEPAKTPPPADALPSKDAPLRSGAPITYTGNVQPILQKFCYDCHATGKRRDELMLDTYKTEDDVVKESEQWMGILDAVRNSEMPPSSRPQPSEEDRALVVRYLSQTLHEDPVKAAQAKAKIAARAAAKSLKDANTPQAGAADAAKADAKPAVSAAGGIDFENQILPILQDSCYTCHGNGMSRGGFSMDDFKTEADVKRSLVVWSKARTFVKNNQMPPRSADQPTEADRDLLVKFLTQELTADDDKAAAKPAVAAAPAIPDDNPDGFLANHITPVMTQYCYDCHGNGASKGGLSLDSFKTVADIQKDTKTWEKVRDYMRSHTMPPAGKPEPSQYQRDFVNKWIEQTLFKYDPAHPDPGRVTIRRLNRSEYDNTIRDLVGVDFHPAEDFPLDDSGYGFDNISDVLSLPPVLMEKYIAAADKILDQAIVTDPIKTEKKRTPANLAEVAFNALGDRGDGWIQLISLEEDDVAVEPETVAGDYIVRVMAFAIPGAGQMVGGGDNTFIAGSNHTPTKLTFMVGNTVVKTIDNITTDAAHPQVYEARIGSPGGKVRFRAVNKRLRGGDNENTMVNGKIGKQQEGMLLVKWMEVEGPLPAETRRIPAKQLEPVGDDGRWSDAGERIMEHNGEVATKLNVPKDGDFILRAQAYGQQCGKDAPKMEFRIDGKPLGSFDVVSTAKLTPVEGQRLFSITLLNEMPQVYELQTHLTAGEHRFSAAYTNDFEDPKTVNPNYRDRNLVIQHLEVVDLGRPVMTPPIPAQLQTLIDHPPLNRSVFTKVGKFVTHGQPSEAEKARATIGEFARQAWRRPVQPEELDSLMKLYDLARQQGDGYLAGLKLAMKGTLVSSHFLFRGEVQPDPDNPNSIHPVDEYALASRLSYFLWSSEPDAELLDLARRGALRKNMQAQVQRMLASPKAQSLVDNFAGQWLEFRGLDNFAPDKSMFPDFDDSLRNAMKQETSLFFNNVMRENRSVLDFLDGDYTFVNERLAKHYGIPGIKGDAFQKVSLIGTHRSGVLTQGSVLMLTSNPTRTSPVKRGKWVLENLLGAPPPPPPPDVPELKNDGQPLSGTLREQMVKHRENPNCASCHARMDPIGFGLENFDATGAWRTKDGDFTLDPSGTLTTGESFAGATELSIILARKLSEDFVHCLSEKMLTFALGRGLEYYDAPAVDKIAKTVKENQFHFDVLVQAVAESYPFQMRRGEKKEQVADSDKKPEAAPAKDAKAAEAPASPDRKVASAP